MTYKIMMDDLELATTLTALRAWQRQLELDEHDPELVDENIGTLTAEEIDEFCERISLD